MKRYISFIAVCLSVLTLPAQEVVKVQVGDNQNYGITYAIPSTAVRIKAEASCTIIKAGIFAPYAEKYLGLTDAPMEDQTEWTVTSVEMIPYTQADSSRTFHVKFNEKELPPTIYLGEQGQLLAINKEPQAKAYVDTPKEFPSDEAVTKKVIHATNVMNEELLKAGSKSKQAEIAARQIFRIRESRMNLLTGDVDNLPADGLSFQLVLDNLEAQEAAYMELFTGVKTVSTASREYIYRPSAEEKKVLFRFSRHFGFVDADDLSGEPYYLTLHITDDKRRVPVKYDAKGKALPQATGVAYVVPGKAQLSISIKGTIVQQDEWIMSQFGHIEHLPANQFTNKKAPAAAWFDSKTGALELFNLSTVK